VLAVLLTLVMLEIQVLIQFFQQLLLLVVVVVVTIHHI
jgi:hypothetical protein